MIQSEKISELCAALEAVQSALPTMPKSSQAYGYKYTDLDTIVDTIKPILHKNGIAYLQSVGGLSADCMTLTTRVFHKSGEYIEDTAALPVITSTKNNAAQTLGMSITYMRRYALCAMLGITSDEDTDADGKNGSEAVRRTDGNTPKSGGKAKPQGASPKASAKAENPKITLKGGESTEAEKARIVELYKAKYANGNPVFSKEELTMYSKSRQTERTAAELIAFVEHALRNRRPDAIELHAGNSQSALSAQAEKGATAAFDGDPAAQLAEEALNARGEQGDIF